MRLTHWNSQIQGGTEEAKQNREEPRGPACWNTRILEQQTGQVGVLEGRMEALPYRSLIRPFDCPSERCASNKAILQELSIRRFQVSSGERFCETKPIVSQVLVGQAVTCAGMRWNAWTGGGCGGHVLSQIGGRHTRAQQGQSGRGRGGPSRSRTKEVGSRQPCAKQTQFPAPGWDGPQGDTQEERPLPGAVARISRCSRRRTKPICPRAGR